MRTDQRPILRQFNTADEQPDPNYRKLRVGIFTESYPPVVNGVTTSVLALIEQLREAGHEVFVFASHFPGYKDDSPNVTRFRSIVTKYERGYPIPLPVSRRIISAIGDMHLDILHTQSPFLLGLVALQSARAFNLPLIATNHTLYTEYTHYVPGFPQDWVKWTTRTWVGFYYRHCDAILAPSDMAGRRLRSEYKIPDVPITTVPSGIPIPAAIPEAACLAVRAQYGIPADAPVLMYAGRLAKEKNLEMLIESCRDVIFPAVPNARLVLAGSGMHADALKEIIAASSVLQGRVTLTGFLERTKLDPIYACANLFVFTSVTETQGMVIGEALAVGTPAVVVNEGGAPESVTDGIDGIRVPNDKVIFGEAVVGLLKNPERLAAMGSAGLRSAQSRTPRCMADRVLEVYGQVLSGPAIHHGEIMLPPPDVC